MPIEVRELHIRVNVSEPNVSELKSEPEQVESAGSWPQHGFVLSGNPSVDGDVDASSTQTGRGSSMLMVASFQFDPPGDERPTDLMIGTPPADGHGSMNVVLADGSVRGISPLPGYDAIGNLTASTGPLHHETPFYLKLQGVDGDSPSSTLPERQAMLKMLTADYAIGDERYTYVFVGSPPAPDHSGGIMVGFGDGSVRSIPPAIDAAGVTEVESGLIYSGESGGMSASETTATGHYTQMMWDDTIHPAAAEPFFAYDQSFLGGVNVASASDAGFGGGVVVAAGDLDGLRPHVFSDFALV